MFSCRQNCTEGYPVAIRSEPKLLESRARLHAKDMFDKSMFRSERKVGFHSKKDVVYLAHSGDKGMAALAFSDETAHTCTHRQPLTGGPEMVYIIYG